eukprot:354873-Pelagomonas_calceolata.AAC.1
MKAVNIKNGKYLPEEAPCNYPRNRLVNQDLFLIHLSFNLRLQKRDYKEASKETGNTKRSLIKVHSMNAINHQDSFILGEETDISSYRPIGLANTLCKLWTRMVTNTLYKYAEAHSLLSSTQAGIRNQEDTIHQLQNVIMGLEDSNAFGEDICPHRRFHFCF